MAAARAISRSYTQLPVESVCINRGQMPPYADKPPGSVDEMRASERPRMNSRGTLHTRVCGGEKKFSLEIRGRDRVAGWPPVPGSAPCRARLCAGPCSAPAPAPRRPRLPGVAVTPSAPAVAPVTRRRRQRRLRDRINGTLNRLPPDQWNIEPVSIGAGPGRLGRLGRMRSAGPRVPPRGTPGAASCGSGAASCGSGAASCGSGAASCGSGAASRGPGCRLAGRACSGRAAGAADGSFSEL